MGRKKKNFKKPTTQETPKCLAEKDLQKLEEPVVKEKCEDRRVTCDGHEDSKSPINVYSRLTYPLVHSLSNQSFDDSDGEDTVELNFWPRFVFVSNLCLVCMEESNVLCDACKMVSYCSHKHKKQNLPKHRDLCKVLTEICTNEGGLSLAKELSADHYRIYRLKLIEIIECGMKRPLDLWEKEIILYPRVCRTCHDSSRNLKCCTDCGIDFYCDNHESDHKRWCRDFQVLRKVLQMQYKHGHVDPEIYSAPRKIPLTLPENFDVLTTQLYSRSSYYSKMDCYTYSTLSHISTIPLTTLYSVQTACSHWMEIKNLVIHVIGAEFQFECINLHVWEKFFLHFLPNLKKLTLAFIGPELQLPKVPVDLLAKVKVCSSCKLAGRTVDVLFYPGMFYHDYSRSKQFVKPDFVCLFNPGLYRHTAFNGRDTWPDTIREFCKTEVPITVTSYTKHEIPQEMERLRSICNIDVILEPRRNPFASIKPDRNFVSDDTAPLIYKNYYVAIVKGKA